MDKMYSMSSQIFEGITEYIVSQRYSGDEKSETQQGPLGSGRVVGDIIRNNEMHSEAKVLNDYSFSLFEKRLLEDSRVTTLNSESGSAGISKLQVNNFVKVTSKLVFNDMRSIKKQLPNLTKLGGHSQS